MTRVVRNIGYRTREAPGAQLLHSVSLTAKTGSVTLIAGHTGSGKSTLLQLLSGLKEQTSGTIAVSHRPTGASEQKLARDALLKTGGYVHQYPEHQFFLPTVEKELAYALKKLRLPPEERSRRIGEAAAVCQIGPELMSRSPFLLSGGEKRRAAIAAVMAAEPDWLLMDEPSAGLDSDMAHWLAQQLSVWSRQKATAERGGILIASHDLELFLPVADSVVLLRGGRSLGQWTPGELAQRPEILAAAGLGLPACTRLSRFAGSRGLTPADIAEGLVRRLEGRGKEEGLSAPGAAPRQAVPVTVEKEEPEAWSSPRQLVDVEKGEPEAWSSTQPVAAVEKGGSPEERENPFYFRAAAMDPRAKWFLYLLFSLFILIKPAMAVSAAGFGAVAVLAAALGLSWRRWVKPLAPLGLFMLVAFLISGIRLSLSHPLTGTGFSLPAALETLNRLGSLLPVMAGGVLFNASTSPLSIQKGVEAPLKRIPYMEKAADATGLAVALMFRFLRFIPQELGRFALLASIRGGSAGKPGKVRLRQLPSFFTPMLLSVMQHAEELSIALEARGYGRKGAARTNAAPLRFSRSDATACLAGAIVVAGLAGLRWLTG